MSLQFSGTPTLYDSSQTSRSSTTSTGNWFFPYWGSQYNSKNWTPSYTSTVQVNIPVEGLYAIQFSLGTTTAASGEIVINRGTSLTGNFFDGYMLAAQCWNSAYTGFDPSCSAFAYIFSGQFVTFAIYLASGTLTLGDRSRAQLVLIQWTA